MLLPNLGGTILYLLFKNLKDHCLTNLPEPDPPPSSAILLRSCRAEANGGQGAEHPPGDHLWENFALLSEFLRFK